MTAGDLPTSTGVPDQGFEGNRFVGLNLYDALTGWDLSKREPAPALIPKLATSWTIDPADHTRWIFKLRDGVKYHDGCPFGADDVVWNFQRYTDKNAPGWDALVFALARPNLTNFSSIELIDPLTVAIKTKAPDSIFPYEISLVPMISRCRAEAVKFDWQAYMKQPSGTGPVPFRQHGAARAHGARSQQGVLGCLPPAKTGSSGAAADAGGIDPGRGTAQRAGEFHRGAAAGFDRSPEILRHDDRHQHLSAQLDVSAQFRERTIQGCAGAPAPPTTRSTAVT